MRRALCLGVVLLCTACNRSDQSAKPAVRRGLAPEAVQAEPTEMPTPRKRQLRLAGVELKQVEQTLEAPTLSAFAKKLDGSWLFGAASASAQAWKIDGERLTVWDGKAEHQRTLSVLAPCLLRIDAGDHQRTVGFALRGGQLLVGGDALGLRGEHVAAVCDGGRVFLQSGKRCVVFGEDLFGDQRSLKKIRDSDCQLIDDTFSFDSVDGKRSIPVDGDLIIGSESRLQVARRLSSWDRAKELVDLPAAPAR
ncbi:MAG: hypothetical protein H6707_21260 [Deltaproteobacteria bacterium]|nr:hypothetical protein [Deltaproteobacteria bacterium]